MLWDAYSIPSAGQGDSLRGCIWEGGSMCPKGGRHITTVTNSLIPCCRVTVSRRYVCTYTQSQTNFSSLQYSEPQRSPNAPRFPPRTQSKESVTPFDSPKSGIKVLYFTPPAWSAFSMFLSQTSCSVAIDTVCRYQLQRYAVAYPHTIVDSILLSLRPECE